jgi:Pyridine nucleotide-disulphide oxidoreductase
MGEVRAFDLDARRVVVDGPEEGEQHLTFAYDTLIVAGGSRHSYFGHDEWRQYAHEIKSLESATAVRQRIFAAFEAAELQPDPERREPWLTFIVIGGGPTGVEMAGQIAELARHIAPRLPLSRPAPRPDPLTGGIRPPAAPVSGTAIGQSGSRAGEAGCHPAAPHGGDGSRRALGQRTAP